ncbi:MAG: putative metal-binding motif-containing protein [Alphaproteobacteria bacterium]|nr:putative metal-binding motif-containing protein [Alphaproteobacteria bacterium]
MRPMMWLALLPLACGDKDLNDSVPQDADGDGVVAAEDCDDAAATVFPGAEERCDGVDQDCDDAIDEGVTQTWYPDADQDGFGDADGGVEACSPPAGHLATGEDCDDADPDARPNGTEVCDDADNDCDGDVDEGLRSTFYEDADGDGYGRSTGSAQLCGPTSGYAEQTGDCDDGDAAVHPDQEDPCDEVDNDCDRAVDEDGPYWYADVDADSYGDPANTTRACTQPTGYVAAVADDDNTDCDDGSAATYPGAADRCDGDDNDCDSAVDEEYKAGWTLVTYHEEGEVYEVDPATGALTLLTTLALTGNPSTSDVREDGLSVIHDATDLSIKETDLCTSTVTDIGPTGAGILGGIGFGPGGILYGLDYNNDNTVRLDTSTGTASVIGGVGFDLGYTGLAYDCTHDILYGVDRTSQRLFQVDTSTGRLGSFVSVNLSWQVVGLEYDAARGLLLTSTGTDLYEIDPSTGSATHVGSFGTDRISDLAWHPPCN